VATAKVVGSNHPTRSIIISQGNYGYYIELILSYCRTNFNNALDKKDRREFEDMWDIPRLYITACSNSVQLLPLHPIFISIVFDHYNQLMELNAQVEQMKEEEQPRK
jgi:hypothetical protein